MGKNSRSRALRHIGKTLLSELRAHRALVAIILFYCLFALVLGARVEREVDLFLYSGQFLGAIVAITLWFVYRRFARLLARPDRSNLLKNLYTDVKASVTPEQTLGGGFLFLFYSIYFSTFQSVKVMIPAARPFTFDVLFAEMDRVIHFGSYPHELLQPLMGYPAVTLAIQFLYNLWFPLMLGMLAWQMFDRRNPHLRMRFLVSFTLVWFVVGSLAAIQLSSAGPVYFDRATGLEGPYGDHMAYLRSVYEVSPLFTLDMQELLWEHYSQGDVVSGMGISAMPSVHVAIATLLFLFGRHLGRWAKWGLGVFAAGIMLGSVHLAWHYAVDGYFGAGLVLVIWWLAGRFYSEVPDKEDTDPAVTEPVQA